MPRPCDILNTSFLGPMVKAPGSANRHQQLYLTLAHWFEGAKFMPHAPQLRESVLFCPTVKEARRFARHRQTDWRSDWQIIRPAVLIAGLGMVSIQCPALKMREVDIGFVREGLEPLGLPARFLDACLERFDVWRKAPRICTFGAEAAPEDIVGVRLSKLVSPLPTWTLVTPCNRRTAWRVHDWALTHYVPVHYVGKIHDRTNNALLQRIVAEVDHVVVFEQRRNKRFDAALQAAKSQGKRISLELYDAAPAPAQQLPGLA